MGKWNGANLKKAIYYLKRNGLSDTWYAVRERSGKSESDSYRYEAPAGEELARQKETPLSWQGVISIVVPTYATPEQYLREMIASVQQQTYLHWELILADATEDDSVQRIVEQYTDERIRYIRLAENAGISENTNQALRLAKGDYIGLLDHDDVLTPDALYEMAVQIDNALKMGVTPGFLYSDEDKCSSDRSRYYEPNHKEDFNLDLLLSNNYICHFLVMESGLIKELGLRKAYDGAQDYDLVLRAVGRLMENDIPLENRIIHIPRVLYHWRCHEASTALNPMSKQYAYTAGKRALQDFADRRGWKVEACDLKHMGFYTLEYTEPLFVCRKDVGAVGGRVLLHKKIVGGRYTADGRLMYAGLHEAYSGYLNRAVLQQDADAVDLRCIRVRKECHALFEKIVGVPYITRGDRDIFDADTLPGGTDVAAASLKLGQALRKAGYRILWQPSVSARIGKRSS